MKRTTIFVDESVEKELQLLSRRRKIPVASLVREALAAYVAHAPEPALSFIGAGASGRSDTATRHEELLWTEPAGKPARRQPTRRKRSR